MRKAKIFFKGIPAGILEEKEEKTGYLFEYFDDYQGPPISLTMPLTQKRYEFKNFPPFFDGVLPEGSQLEALLRQAKLDQDDYFGQLAQIGADLVGAATVSEIK